MELRELLTERSVRARTRARDWEEAVEISGALLVEAGAVEQSYVTAMQRVVRELGPYAVVAPGIALPHARPEDGVLAAGVAVVTLTTPVEFGHSRNDPVDLVVAFAATDKHTHVEALQQLSFLLGDGAAVARIRAAEDDAGLYRAVLGETSSPKNKKADKGPTARHQGPSAHSEGPRASREPTPS